MDDRLRPTDESLRALLVRRELAIKTADYLRGALPLIERLSGVGDVPTARAANRIQLAIGNLERVAFNCVTDLSLASRRFRLAPDLVAAIDDLNHQEEQR